MNVNVLKRNSFIISIYFFVFFVLILTLFPVIWLFLLSLKTQLQAFTYPPLFFFKPTFKHYYEVVVASDFLKFFTNSLLISLGEVALSMLIGVPAAYAFRRAQLRFRRGIITWTLAARMLPAMVYVIPFFYVYTRWVRLIDTRLGLIIVYLVFNLPIVVWTMDGFFAQMPRALEEAAKMDGASTFQTFLHIVLPLSTTGLVATSIIVFMWCWNEFIFALVLTRRRALTAAIAIVNFMAYEGIEWGSLAAGAMIVLIPVILFSIMVRKYLATAVLGGALKG
ncbi:Trehalose transport system permease protein SugB [subsurface metagenome]